MDVVCVGAGERCLVTLCGWGHSDGGSDSCRWMSACVGACLHSFAAGGTRSRLFLSPGCVLYPWSNQFTETPLSYLYIKRLRGLHRRRTSGQWFLFPTFLFSTATWATCLCLRRDCVALSLGPSIMTLTWAVGCSRYITPLKLLVV